MNAMIQRRQMFNVAQYPGSCYPGIFFVGRAVSENSHCQREGYSGLVGVPATLLSLILHTLLDRKR